MTTHVLHRSRAGTVAPARLEVRTSPEAAVTGRAFHQVWKGAVLWALVFGGTVASSALNYVAAFPTVEARQLIAATTSKDAGLSVLLGPIASIDTVGGYTTYKCYVFLTTIGAIWAILAATRLLRGEEDAGRWQLVLAGGTRPARATGATLAALAGAVAVIFVGVTLCTMLAGRSPDVGFGTGETVLYGLSLTIPLAVFVGVGAVTSQLGRTRRFATGMGMTVLAVTFVIRMIADSGPSTQWLLWATPFGWTELMRPLTENNALPLLPAAITVVILGATAVFLSTRRDAGAGLLASTDVSTVRPFGLRSPLGLAARLELPVLVAWSIGLAASGLMFGFIAKLTTVQIPDSMSNTLDRFGIQGTFANQYFGIMFLLIAAVVALLPAGQVGAMAEEETSGRLVHLLGRPTKRVWWFAGRLALAAAGVATAALLSGLCGWLGASTQGVEVRASSLIAASLNVIPIALVALGFGALMVALVPRAAAAAVYGVVAWSLIADLLASLVSSVSWLQHLSLFHYMALAPAQDPEPLNLVITTGIAVVLCVAAGALFARRDLRRP